MALKSFPLTMRALPAEIDVASTKPIPLMSLSDAETQDKLVWLTEGYYQTYRAAINQSPYVSNRDS